jgi:hypothetical protein
MTMKVLPLLLLLTLARAASAQVAGPIRPDQAAFRELFKELVETTRRCRRAAARWPPNAWRRG